MANKNPICIGAGLVTLDVVINGRRTDSPRAWAGGSCGNVLTILSYLGWKTIPLARTGNDEARKRLLKDMRKYKVDTSFVLRDNAIATPIIVERITKRNGIRRHRFEWRCPDCGVWLPRFRPLTIQQTEKMAAKLPKPQVFYFDRIAPSIIRLANRFKQMGALIVFEPSGIGDPRHFKECLLIADIVKYSNERLGHAHEFLCDELIPLELETLGSDGLRICDRRHKKKANWVLVDAYSVGEVKDTAGAGDWCTAGIIHLLGSMGRKTFEKANNKDIKQAIAFGQALAALKCKYECPRGVMYEVTKDNFIKMVEQILVEKSVQESTCTEQKTAKNISLELICPDCCSKSHASK